MMCFDRRHGREGPVNHFAGHVLLDVPVRLTPFENQPQPLPKDPGCFRDRRPDRPEHGEHIVLVEPVHRLVAEDRDGVFLDHP